MNERLPNLPPDPDEPIGLERARAYIAWIRRHAPPVLQEARRMIQERYPGAVTNADAVTLEQLATWSFGPPMKGLSIGTVHASVSGGAWAMVDIVITEDGQLIVKPGWNMR